MSDITPGTSTEPDAKAPAQEPEKIDTTDWKAEARKWERQAKSNKTAADELAALKDSQKSEAQKFEERLAAIEKQAKESEDRALRAEIANAKGLTPNQAKRLIGSTREELEADADELLKDIGQRKKQGNRVPDEGKTPPKSGDDPMREFARNLFGANE